MSSFIKQRFHPNHSQHRVGVVMSNSQWMESYIIYMYIDSLSFTLSIKSLVEVAGVEPASLLPSARISTRLFYFGVSKGYEVDQPTLSIRFKVIQSPIRQTTLVPWKMTPTPNYPSNHSGDGVDLSMPPTQPLRLPKQKTLPWRLR